MSDALEDYAALLARTGVHPANECGDPYDCPAHSDAYRASPREEDGDYAREFFDAYERQADEADLSWRRTEPEDQS